MEQKEELVAFAKEVIRQRPSRQMLRIYMIGSTLALLGTIAGLLQGIFSPEEEEQQPRGQRRQVEVKLRDNGTITALRTEEEQEEGPGQSCVPEQDKGGLWRDDRRRSSANRLHAS